MRTGLGLLALVATFLVAVGAASAAEPWQAAEQVDAGLFEAQSELTLDERADALAQVRRAEAAFNRGLAPDLQAVAAGAVADARAGLEAAAAATRAGDDIALGSARGLVQGAIYLGTFRAALDAAGNGKADAAASWLLIREFRTATKFTRPGADATIALNQLRAGDLQPADARIAVAKDLLDSYQARLREIVDDAVIADGSDFDASRAERAALASGIWQILRDRYREELGAPALAQADRRWNALRLAGAGAVGGFERSARAALGTLEGFTAAPFTPEEEARYAIQLTRFVDLIPFEWSKGVDGETVTTPFEIQEAKSFRDGAETAFSDLEGVLRERDPAAASRIDEILAELKADIAIATSGAGPVATEDEIQSLADEALDLLNATYPEEWKGDSVDSDFDLVLLTLDRMDTAIRAGQYDQAEQARLAAYAFFEFGPELRLRSLDPGLSFDIEGLVWFGARDYDEGLAELIDRRAPSSETRPVRVALDELLEDARAALGDGASKATIVTNAAIVVFREGLEAVLILAAVLAGMRGATGRLRRPIWVGVLAALVASAITFVLAQTVLDQFSQYGEKLEAVVGLVAIAVLLVVLNWFLHKVYWSNWISGFNRKRKELVETAGAGLLTGQAVGLILLGFSMTYREGFETVLFLQALALEAGIATVLEGTAIGLAAVLAVGFATFALEKRLPYKRMLVLTGLLIGLVLVILVGNTARTMQGVGWLSITPIDVDMPYWLGLWFGVYPTVETIGAQIAAAAFVIGSYYAAEWVRKRRVRLAAREALSDTPEPEDRVGSTRSRTQPEPTEENLGRRPAEANPPLLRRARRSTVEDRALRDPRGVAGGEGDRQGGRVLEPLLRDRGGDGEG